MPRLPPITRKDELPPGAHAAFESIVASRGAVHGPFQMFLHSPELARRVAHLGAYVRFDGTLDMRVRTLAAMTVGRELDVLYIWGAQTAMARKLGIPETTISAIRERHARGIPLEDAAVVEFTRALLRRHRVEESEVAALRQRFGDDQYIQLTGTIGYYTLLAMTMNACELEAPEGAESLST